MADVSSHDTIRAEFIEKTGLFSQAEGLPRIAGRVLGLLIYDGDVVPFGELAVKLQVSRASISTSVRLLEERGLVKRVNKPGERQSFFQLAPDPYGTMLKVVQQRNRSFQAEIAETIESLPEEADAQGRLKAYYDFYASIGAAISVALTEVNKPEVLEAGQQPATLKGFKDDE